MSLYLHIKASNDNKPKMERGYHHLPFQTDIPSSSSSVDAIDDRLTPWLGWISAENGEIFHSCFQGNNGIILFDKILEDGKDNDESHANQEEMQIVLERISKYTNFEVVKIASKSAGIKTSVEQDRNMVIGCDPMDSSFVWVSALSGYGIQTAPAYSDIVSYLATDKDLPQKYLTLV